MMKLVFLYLSRPMCTLYREQQCACCSPYSVQCMCCVLLEPLSEASDVQSCEGERLLCCGSCDQWGGEERRGRQQGCHGPFCGTQSPRTSQNTGSTVTARAGQIPSRIYRICPIQNKGLVKVIRDAALTFITVDFS